MVYTDGIHLVADNLVELHRFAEEVGLERHYYEGVRKGHPHYDLLTTAGNLVRDKDGKVVRDKLTGYGVKVIDKRRLLGISKELLNPPIDVKEVAKTVMNKYPEYVLEYKAGKTGLLGLFVGEAMKLTKGKGEPKELNRAVIEMLG